MMTYTFILKGIEKMDFPKKISKRPEDLIRKLCRYKNAVYKERLIRRKICCIQYMIATQQDFGINNICSNGFSETGEW